MLLNCCIKDCSNNSVKNRDCKFYLFPQIRMQMNARSLSVERRQRWWTAINRKIINTKTARVCSKHFISGKSAKLHDTMNPDWVPSLHLGHARICNPNILAGRYRRQKKPIDKIAIGETVRPVLPSVSIPQFEEVMTESSTYEEFLGEEYLEDYLDEIDPVNEKSNNSFGTQTNLDQEPFQKSIGTQTDLDQGTSFKSIGVQIGLGMKEENSAVSMLKKRDLFLKNKELEISELRSEITKFKMGMEFFKDSDAKTRYFTGLSHYVTLFTIYKAIEANIPNCFRKGINKFQVLVLTLIKLRLDLPFTLLGYMFGISTQTASKKFYDCVAVLGSELSSFVTMPDKSAPDKQANLNPNGASINTSKGCGGKSSDIIMSEISKFVSFPQPEDIVISDVGLLIEEAEEPIRPAFVKGRLHLHPFSVEESRNLAQLRITVEKVVDKLSEKYLILTKTQSNTSISKKPETNEIYIDAIVRTCCALVNLSPVVTNSALQVDD